MSSVTGADTTVTFSRDQIMRWGSFGLLALIVVGNLASRLFSKKEDRWRSYGRSSPVGSQMNPVSKLIFGLYFVGAPVVLAALVFLITVHPDPQYGIVARAIFPAVRSDYGKSAAESVIPLYPRNLTEAYLYGELGAELKACRGAKPAAAAVNGTAAAAPAGSAECSAGVLARAAVIAMHNVSAEQLLALESICRDMDGGKGLISKFFGALTIVNLIWFVAILGITATVIPFLAVVLGPLVVAAAAFVAKIFVDLVVPVIRFLWLRIIRHVAALFFYFFALWAAVEATRYPRNDMLVMAPVMIATLSLGMALCGWMYVTVFQAPKSGGNEELWLSMTGTIFAALAGLFAVAFQSKLLGYITYVALLVGLGFSMFSGGLWVCIGFDNRDAAWRCISATLTLNVLFAAARAADLDTHQYLAPFASAVSIFGTAVYFLGLLIWSFVFDAHALYVINIIGHVIVGFSSGNVGMANTALVYAALFALTFFFVLTAQKGNAIIGIFLGFVALYFIASALSTHPEYLSYAIFGSAD